MEEDLKPSDLNGYTRTYLKALEYVKPLQEELARQALKRKLKRAVRGPKEAKRQARVAERARSFWDV